MSTNLSGRPYAPLSAEAVDMNTSVQSTPGAVLHPDESRSGSERGRVTSHRAGHALELCTRDRVSMRARDKFVEDRHIEYWKCLKFNSKTNY